MALDVSSGARLITRADFGCAVFAPVPSLPPDWQAIALRERAALAAMLHLRRDMGGERGTWLLGTDAQWADWQAACDACPTPGAAELPSRPAWPGHWAGMEVK